MEWKEPANSMMMIMQWNKWILPILPCFCKSTVGVSFLLVNEIPLFIITITIFAMYRLRFNDACQLNAEKKNANTTNKIMPGLTIVVELRPKF